LLVLIFTPAPGYDVTNYLFIKQLSRAALDKEKSFKTNTLGTKGSGITSQFWVNIPIISRLNPGHVWKFLSK
jgi:hypothetical protein